MSATKIRLLLILPLIMGLTAGKTMAQKLSIGSKFPTFQTTDIWGQPLNSTSATGKTWWLFNRNIGCPVCNLRMHNIGKLADSLTKAGHRVIMVMESPAERIKSYVGEEPGAITYVSDTSWQLYGQVGAERSAWMLTKGIFTGLLKKVKAGEKVMGGSRKQDGHMTTIPSEFVVDANGKVLLAYYPSFAGDEPAIEVVEKLF